MLPPGLFCRIQTADGSSWAKTTEGGFQLLSAAPWLAHTAKEKLGGDGVVFLAPAEPSKVVCVGRNYAAHAAELGNAVPKAPLLFLKPPSSLIGAGASIVRPAVSERVEHEGELAAVIGKTLKAGDPQSAEDAVFGWTTANDITARDLQRADVQFTRGKGFDTFCPLGPAIRTTLDVHNLRLRTYVNGELRQEGQTSQMTWAPYDLIAYISSIMTLMPGDVVLTGTPAGVGPLLAGDEVRVDIEGLPSLTNSVVDG